MEQQKEKRRWGGIGCPLRDIILPTDKELRYGLALVLAKKGFFCGKLTEPPELDSLISQTRAAARQSADHDIFLLNTMLDGRDALYQLASDRKAGSGSKVQLATDETQLADQNLTLIRNGIKVINTYVEREGGFAITPITLDFVGGTVWNKIRTLQAARGDYVECSMLGYTGQDPESACIRREMAAAGICLEDDGFEVPLAARSFILPTHDNDRILLKAAATNGHAQQQFYTPEKIRGYVSRQNTVFLEASDIGKYGLEIFETAVNAAIENNVHIVFAPPTNPVEHMFKTTDEEYMEKVLHAKDIINKAMHYPNTRMITLNEKEAIEHFLDIEKPEEFEGLYDPVLLRAVGKARELLKEKNIQTGVEPLIVISVGKDGAIAITPNRTVYQPGQPLQKDEIESTVGCGDNFATGCLIKRNEIMVAKRSSSPEKQVFDEDDLHKILSTGQTMGRLNAMCKQATLPPHIIHAVAEGNVRQEGVIVDYRPGIEMKQPQAGVAA